MWRSNLQVHRTQSWEHDRMSREVESVTGHSTEQWFRRLDRFGARRRGMVRTLAWLRDRHHLPHYLATTLAWNYFNPTTLPDEIASRVDRRPHRPAKTRAARPASARRHRVQAVRRRAPSAPARRAKAAPGKDRAAKRQSAKRRPSAGSRPDTRSSSRSSGRRSGAGGKR